MQIDALIAAIVFAAVLLATAGLPLFWSRARRWVTASFKDFPFDFITTCVTTWGVLAAGITLYFLYDQGVVIRENQDAQAYANVYQAQLALDQVEEQHPELTPYFERKEPIQKNDTHYDFIEMVSEHKLDVIDYFFSQHSIVNLKGDEYKAWIYYFRSSFANSEVLCDTLRERQQSYGDDILAVAWYSGCKNFPKPTSSASADLAKYFTTQ